MIYLFGSVCDSRCFKRPYGFFRSDNLSVYVRNADFVVIDNFDRSHAGADESLYAVTADAARAEHGDLFIFEYVGASFA